MKIKLSDQEQISNEEYSRAINSWINIKDIYNNREKYIKENNLNENIFIPSLGWSNEYLLNDLKEWFNKIPTKRRIEQLRLATHVWTGYSLINQESGKDLKRIPQLVNEKQFDVNFEKMKPNKSVLIYKKIMKQIPDKYLIKVPKKLGEVGLEVNGRIVNIDVLGFQECINKLHKSGVIKILEDKIKRGQKVRVLEIGSGYGGFTYFLKTAIPEIEYSICDIPESLVVASMYLSVVLKGDFKIIPNYKIEELTKGKEYDLVINMLSMSEMSEEQIRYYCEKIKEFIKNKGVFFEANFNNKHLGWTDSKKIIKEYFRKRKKLGFIDYKGDADLWEI